MVGDFNILLLIMNRISKTRKETGLNNKINQLDLTNIHKPVYTFFSRAHGISSSIGHGASLS